MTNQLFVEQITPEYKVEVMHTGIVSGDVKEMFGTLYQNGKRVAQEWSYYKKESYAKELAGDLVFNFSRLLAEKLEEIK